MADLLDIFNPQISMVSYGIEGKIILIYGDNNLGKTKQATRLPKPVYLAFEKGINAIAGVPFFSINSWSDFKKLNKRITNPKTLDKAKELYQTLIFDTVEVAALFCETYVCDMYDVNRLNDGNQGYGLWKEYANEFRKEILQLTGAGYTVVFIAHDTIREIDGVEKIYPKGDKRAIDPICDACDIIGYVINNGLDEEGNEIISSISFKNAKEYKARTKFTYMQDYIEEFTAENLEKAITEGIKKQEEVEGIKTVSPEDFKQAYESIELDFDELLESIKQEYIRLNDLDKLEDYQRVVEEYLGVDAIVSEASRKQVQQLDLILQDLKEIEE